MNKFIYLDAAASSLKPDCVVQAELDFLRNSYANAGRGICARAVAVDSLVKSVRKQVADFIGADEKQIVFTSGTTDSMNRIPAILKNSGVRVQSVAVSDLDHHSARLPWEYLAKNSQVNLKVCSLNENLDFADVPESDVLVITAMSNVIGKSQDVKAIINQAKSKNPNVITIVDVAQYIVHEKINVVDWDCDFLAFSGHKIGADTGIGVLYIKKPERFSPDKFGGGMINKIIDSDNWIYNMVPDKFEAGTLPLTQIAGLGEAIRYLEKNRPDLSLIKYLYDELKDFQNIDIISAPDSCLFSFVPKNMHALDFGALIGANDICLRVGNMCASWIHKYLGVPASVRISIGSWNTLEDIKLVIELIKKILK